MRSVFTFCAVLMAAVFATACVEGVEGVDGIEEEELEEVELEEVELEEVEVELPAAPAPEVVTPPQELRLNDDPDEGGQIKRAADRAARNTARR